MSDKKRRRFPVLKDLSERDRTAFEDWLAGSQMPVNSDSSKGYYPHDYERFKCNQQRNKN